MKKKAGELSEVRESLLRDMKKRRNFAMQRRSSATHTSRCAHARIFRFPKRVPRAAYAPESFQLGQWRKKEKNGKLRDIVIKCSSVWMAIVVPEVIWPDHIPSRLGILLMASLNRPVPLIRENRLRIARAVVARRQVHRQKIVTSQRDELIPPPRRRDVKSMLPTTFFHFDFNIFIRMCFFPSSLWEEEILGFQGYDGGGMNNFSPWCFDLFEFPSRHLKWFFPSNSSENVVLKTVCKLLL